MIMLVWGNLWFCVVMFFMIRRNLHHAKVRLGQILVAKPNDLIAFVTALVPVLNLAHATYWHQTQKFYGKYIQSYAFAWGCKKVNKMEAGAYVFGSFCFF